MTNDPYQIPDYSLEQALKPEDNSRISAGGLFGQAVSASKIGDIITANPPSTNLGTGTSSGLITIANATSAVYKFTVTDNNNRVILAIPDVSVYINATDTASQWPNASYGMGNVPVFSWLDWGQSNNVNVVSRTAVRNNTGGSITAAVVVRFRIITNSSAALSGLTTGGISQ